MISISVTKYHLGVLFCKADSDTVDVLGNLITDMKHALIYITIKKIFWLKFRPWNPLEKKSCVRGILCLILES
jgi:hypothetical protein